MCACFLADVPSIKTPLRACFAAAAGTHGRVEKEGEGEEEVSGEVMLLRDRLVIGHSMCPSLCWPSGFVTV